LRVLIAKDDTISRTILKKAVRKFGHECLTAEVRGSGREYLMRLAAHLGLVDSYLKDLGSRRRWRRARAAENLGYFGAYQ
jgi:DNA-binding response OmpR family regulator